MPEGEFSWVGDLPSTLICPSLVAPRAPAQETRDSPALTQALCSLCVQPSNHE